MARLTDVKKPFYLIEDYCIPCLIGRNPFDTEDTWQFFYRAPYWKRGPVTMTSVAAIDMALWDIKAKILNVPLYNLLGGKSRNKILVYSHAQGKDIEHTMDEVARQIELGYRAIVYNPEYQEFRILMVWQKVKRNTNLRNAANCRTNQQLGFFKIPEVYSKVIFKIKRKIWRRC